MDLALPFDPQHAGDQAASAQAKQIPELGKQVEPGRNQRYRCYHQRIPGLPNEKGIRQIIYHRHYLADDSRDGQHGYRSGDRDSFKQFSLAALRHENRSAFFPD